MDSYKRSAKAASSGVFKSQIIPVSIPQKKGKPDLVINEDEEYKRVDFDKFEKLATVFQVQIITSHGFATDYNV